MSTESQQGRRLACDRCRGQKLKCERSNIPDCCQRCRKADAPCSFGQALPPGRPRTNNISLPESPARTEPTPAVSTSPKTTANHDVQPSRNEHGHGLGPAPSSSAGLDELSANATWSQPTNVDDDSSMTDLIYDDAFAVEFGPPFSAWSDLGTASDKSGLSWPDINQSHHNGGLHTLFNSMTNITEIGNNIQQQGSSSASYNLPPTPQSARRVPSHQQQTISSRLNLHVVVQSATQLSNSMHELHTKYSRHNYDGQDQRDTFPTDLSGEVLQVATKFLELLCCFLSTELETSARTTTNMCAPIIARDDSPTDNSCVRADSVSQALVAAGSSFGRASKQQQRRTFMDKPAALQLIASYQRLLDLYLLLYKAVYDFLCHSSNSNSSRSVGGGGDYLLRQPQPIWKDLTLGGVALDQFADLQIKFVLQVAARILEKIEGALGLPEGSRVSKNSVVDGNGILNNMVTAHFVELCMAEEAAAGPYQGRGAIAQIREMTTSLAVILDAPGTR